MAEDVLREQVLENKTFAKAMKNIDDKFNSCVQQLVWALTAMPTTAYDTNMTYLAERLNDNDYYLCAGAGKSGV